MGCAGTSSPTVARTSPAWAALAHGQSTTANVLFAVEATRRWASDGVTADALVPGGIWTPLQRNWSAEQHAAAERSP